MARIVPINTRLKTALLKNSGSFLVIGYGFMVSPLLVCCPIFKLQCFHEVQDIHSQLGPAAFTQVHIGHQCFDFIAAHPAFDRCPHAADFGLDRIPGRAALAFIAISHTGFRLYTVRK